MLGNTSLIPAYAIMLYEVLVARSKSLSAPVEICPVHNSSAARPPNRAHNSSNICSLVVIWRSSGRYHAAPNALPRGTIETLTSGLACSQNQDTVACPASCKAMVRFSLAVIILVFFSSPPIILSTASKKSCFPTLFLLCRAAIRAASLQTFAMSAPEKPGVCLERKSMSKSGDVFTFLRWTKNISFLSGKSGRSTLICLSKRPARNSALSNMSARLVAAKIITPLLVPKPSISVSRAFKVFSRSSLPPMDGFLLRALPTASISSIKIIEGDFSLAWRNKSRTRLAPTPTNISTKSEPLIEKKGTPASPATALARRVLPVPGGPTNNAPLGIFPPKSVYLWGFFKKSTISCTSCLAPACPATSLKVTPMSLPFSYIFALLLPTLKTPPPAPPAPPPIRRMNRIHKTIRKMGNERFMRMFQNSLPLSFS